MIDKFFNENYNKIKNMAYKYSHKNNNTLYIKDLISECYLFIKENEKRYKTPLEIKKGVAYFFYSQFFHNSATSKLKGKLNTEELEDYDQKNEEEPNNDICIMQVKEDLPEIYRHLFKIMFEEKKYTLRELQEELNTTKYGADRMRKRLYDLIGTEKPNFRQIDKKKLYL